MLEAAGSERLTELRKKDQANSTLHAALTDLRKHLEKSAATIGEKDRRVAMMEAAASERLTELQRKIRLIPLFTLHWLTCGANGKRQFPRLVNRTCESLALETAANDRLSDLREGSGYT
jgi:hypothetical protein